MSQTVYTPQLGAPSTGVVITGGASGLGHASACALAAVGRPVALWDLSAERAGERAAAISAEYGVKAIGLGVDVRDPDAIAEAARQTRAALPSIGGIVHCAVTVDTVVFVSIHHAIWESVIHVHQTAVSICNPA